MDSYKIVVKDKEYLPDHKINLPIRENESFENITCVFYDKSFKSPDNITSKEIGSQYFEKISSEAINDLKFNGISPPIVYIFKGDIT